MSAEVRRSLAEPFSLPVTDEVSLFEQQSMSTQSPGAVVDVDTVTGVPTNPQLLDASVLRLFIASE